VAFTKRTMHLRRHSGEVSFPGGVREPVDSNLLQTALRESSEEVGLRPEDVAVIGVLDDLPTFGSGFMIRPFVGRIPYPYEFKPDPHEVERMIVSPLAAFADPALRHIETRERDGHEFSVTYFQIGADVVWGATARMISVMLDRLDGREPKPMYVPVT